jgi:serine/threonine protein kinase
MVDVKKLGTSQELNGRYSIEKELGQGSFANVYLCTDKYPSAPGRLLSEEVLASISILEKESPDFEFNEGYGYGYKKEEVTEKTEREIAIDSLKDLSKVFPQNNIHAEAGAVEAPRQVAIKRTKMNAFNDRDGVAFYALREVKLLQQL